MWHLTRDTWPHEVWDWGCLEDISTKDELPNQSANEWMTKVFVEQPDYIGAVNYIGALTFT